MNKNNIGNSMETEETKQERNVTIVAIGAIIFAIIGAFIAINNFWLFMLICLVGTIIFSIANAIVVSIKNKKEM